MADDELARERLIIFPERMVDKATHCANCIHYETDSTKVMEEWRPTRDALDKQVQLQVKFTGLELQGFDRGDVGLKVAQLTRRGMTTEQAIQQVDNEQLLEAAKRVGPETWKADKRYYMIAMTEQGIKKGALSRCRGDGVDGKGEPIGFLTFAGYHCHKWTAKQGWSVAHEGRKGLDPLPAELVEIADSKAPTVKLDDPKKD